MHKILIAALLFSATAASAQQNCEQHRNNRAVGTSAGNGVGGVLGNVIAGSGDRTLATILGAVGAGVLGNQGGNNDGNGNCANAYGYYDKSGVWVASNVAVNQQSGYYDRESNWVAGAPQGYYDSQRRWVAAQNAGNNGRPIGYRDRNGQWVAPVAGDFDANNRYVTQTVPGYWQNGRWIAGTTSGSYDRDGRWMAGQPNGQRDAQGNAVADAQPGYYDRRGRWNAGTARGRYDDNGVWIGQNGGNGNGYADNDFGNNGNGQGNNGNGNNGFGNNGNGNNGNGNNGYGNNGQGNNGQRDIESRFDRIETRIDRGIENRSLSRADANRAEAELASIRRYDRSLRNRNGQISPRNENAVQARLDRLSDRLRNVRDAS